MGLRVNIEEVTIKMYLMTYLIQVKGKTRIINKLLRIIRIKLIEKQAKKMQSSSKRIETI